MVLQLLLAPYWLGQAILAALLFRWTGRPFYLLLDRERRRLLEAYFHADLIVSCPGNFFLSGSGLGLPLFLAVFSLAYGWLLGKPLYMMQQSVGPLRRRIDQLVVGWLLQRIRIVFLRDERSMETLKAIGFAHPKCFLIPDAAFLYQGNGNVHRFLNVLPKPESLRRPFIGATVIDFGMQNRFFRRQQVYENALVDALNRFVGKYGGTVFLFPQVCGPSEAEDDRIPSRRIADALIEKGIPTILIDVPWQAGELQAAYGQMDLFIGTRLHSNIFAMTAGTPVIAIAYFYKTYGIMQMLELSDWVLDIHTVDSEGLVNSLENLWVHRDAIRRHLTYKLPLIREEARLVSRLIRDDYNRFSI
ncbi:MAG: polysaccharide pyruvyl transferase [Caldilinea sp.]|nr:MAG: polysaccharide pyruvyl transferase [Caldilinea sp.]